MNFKVRDITPLLSVPVAIFSMLLCACSRPAPVDPVTQERWADQTIFTIQARGLDGNPVDMDRFRGDVLLVVNVASRCGFTSQYTQLQQLQDRYAEQGLVVIGFPCNQFGGQEPGSSEEIASFCSENYGVEFPMMEKIQVNAGPGQSPIYEFLGTRSGKLPGWNFCKYLVQRDGETVTFYNSSVSPMSETITGHVEKALAVELVTGTEEVE